MRNSQNTDTCYSTANTGTIDSISCQDREGLFFYTTTSPTIITGVKTGSAISFTFEPLTSGSLSGLLKSQSNSNQCVQNSISILVQCDSQIQQQIWTLDPTILSSLTGSVIFQTQENGDVRVIADIKGLLPASSSYNVGLHIHTNGDDTGNNGMKKKKL